MWRGLANGVGLDGLTLIGRVVMYGPGGGRGNARRFRSWSRPRICRI